MITFLVSLASFLVGFGACAVAWYKLGAWWLREPGNLEWLLTKLHDKDPDTYHEACAKVCARPVDTSSEERH